MPRYYRSKINVFMILQKGILCPRSTVVEEDHHHSTAYVPCGPNHLCGNNHCICEKVNYSMGVISYFKIIKLFLNTQGHIMIYVVNCTDGGLLGI